MDSSVQRKVRRCLTAAIITSAAMWGLLISSVFESPRDPVVWILAVLSLVTLYLVGEVRRRLGHRSATSTPEQEQAL